MLASRARGDNVSYGTTVNYEFENFFLVSDGDSTFLVHGDKKISIVLDKLADFSCTISVRDREGHEMEIEYHKDTNRSYGTSCFSTKKYKVEEYQDGYSSDALYTDIREELKQAQDVNKEGGYDNYIEALKQALQIFRELEEMAKALEAETVSSEIERVATGMAAGELDGFPTKITNNPKQDESR